MRAALSKPRLRIREDEPTAAERDRNRRMLDVVLPSDNRSNHAVRAELLSLFPYDWSVRTTVDVHKPPGVSGAEVLHRVRNDAVRILVRAGPLSWPGRNWVNGDDGPCWVALFDMIHGLFSKSMRILGQRRVQEQGHGRKEKKNKGLRRP